MDIDQERTKALNNLQQLKANLQHNGMFKKFQ
jgi:hypothetical protein